MVFMKVRMPWKVSVSPNQLQPGLKLHRTIMLRLFEDFSGLKATKDHGYFIAVTTLDELGDGRVRELTGDVLFPIEFSCVTFKPFRGEVLEGVVDRVLKLGIFLNCGPIEGIFLSAKVMGSYEYMAGDNPHFFSEKLPKMEKGTAIRFKVLNLQWEESDRTFKVLATLVGDFLGPI